MPRIPAVALALALALGATACKSKPALITADTPERAFTLQWELAANDDWRSWWALHTPGLKRLLEVQVDQMDPQAFPDAFGVAHSALPETSAAGLGAAIFAQRKKEAAAGTVPVVQEAVIRGGKAFVRAQSGPLLCLVELVIDDDHWLIDGTMRCR